MPALTEIIERATLDLFDHYERALSPLDAAHASEPDIAYCGVIGFTGDDLRGSLLLAVSRDAIEIDGSLRDWLGELTNQLLGRIKNRLIAYGTVVHGSTPVVMRGDYLAPVTPLRDALAFATGAGGVVVVWFDAEIRPGFELTAFPDAGVEVAPEGDMLLF